MTEKLKPCPFCGSNVKIDMDDFYMFCCDNCGAGVVFAKVFEDGTAGDCDREESIAAWNTRVEEENPPLTLDELRQMDGEPIWCIHIESGMYTGWHIIVVNKPFQDENTFQVLQPLESGTHRHYLAHYGKTWLAYRRKPEEVLE